MNPFFFLTPNILQRAVWPFVRPILKFFVVFKIRGLENISAFKSGVIFASNHSSELDPILLPAAMPFFSKHIPFFYVSRPRDFYKTSGWRQIFYGGLFFKLWGAHPAVSGARNYAKTLAVHIKIIEHGGNLLIFPTGKKFFGDLKDAEARGGAAFLSYATGKPIIPVRINGVANMTFLDFITRRRQVSISFGAPMYFTGRPRVSYKSDSKKVLEAISTELWYNSPYEKNSSFWRKAVWAAAYRQLFRRDAAICRSAGQL
jgi:1-acyl-sn-glycerol-3-phosphate acyltransferase